MKQLFKKYHIPTPVFMLFCVITILFSVFTVQHFRFQNFTDSFFQEEMQSDTLSMHYVLAHPENYGISAQHVSLLPYSKELQREQESRFQEYAKTLNSFHPLFLKKHSRHLLTLLREQLHAYHTESEFSYYAEPLSPVSGIQTNLPVLLAEYTFRTKQDVENYLTLLSQIPAYLEGVSTYEKEKAAAGLFMSGVSADKVIDQCYQLMDSQKLMKDTHFLNTTFSERVQNLVNQQLLTPQEASAYEKKNHQILLEKIMPAYEALGDEILLLKKNGGDCNGLAHLPKGKSYYSFLLKETTGCHRSVTDIKQLLMTQMKQDSEALSQLLKQSPSLLSDSMEFAFPQMTPEQYLSDLQNRMKADFPSFPEMAVLPSHTVKSVSESLEEYCAPAFYLTPPIDDISENSIYINEKDNPDALELYTTLAHEGYPGHLYQTVYDQLYQQKERIAPARNLLNYSGYAEGWALYVEMLSYDYAKELLQEHNAPEDTLLLCDALRLNRSIQLCLYSLLDISIHYDGADEAAISNYLKNFGITDDALVRDIYEYIVEAPANYPKYYVGYLEFIMLKQAAQKKWEEGYSNLRFHKLILETGPCPFPILWENFE